MPHKHIEYIAPGDLRPYAKNARRHSKKQIRQIADSIKTFGWTNPVLIDGERGIIAGHGRIEAAKLLGLGQVPTLLIDHLSEAEKRAYILADNKLAENASWDREALAIELQGLIELDFDIALTGFEMAEIDILIGELEDEDEDDPDDEIPQAESGPAVTRPGDVWLIGKHRLICGDATDADTYARLLDGAKAQMIFTDPPYNVAIDGHVCGLGKVKHREFAMASGEMSAAQFASFLESTFRNLANYSTDGAIHFICMDWRHMSEVLAAGKATYTELKNLCVWAKTNGGMGSLYRSQHELVFVFKAGREPHINNVELGKYGRYRTNVWSYAGINSLGKTRDADLAAHPTVKPIALVKDAILDCSQAGGIVLDAFAGSGTTLLAAEKSGRRGYGIELDPNYCDLTTKRVAAVVRSTAIHAASGKSFAEIEQERSPQDSVPVADSRGIGRGRHGKP